MLEELSPEELEASPLLTEAYGESLYRCPMVNCNRFCQGFANRYGRDEHVKRHKRAHKCTYEGCDYMELGFSTAAKLNRHLQLCHSTSSEGFTFPNVKSVSTSKALKDAIDGDDALAVRDICIALLKQPHVENGFLLRAIRQKSVNAALAVVELLGTKKEVDHKDRNGKLALHEAVRLQHEELLKQILDTEVDVNAEDRSAKVPFLIALEGRFFHAAELLLNHDRFELKPSAWTSEVFHKSFIRTASSGRNDILRAIFESSAEAFAQKPMPTSRMILRSLAEAGSNNHESTVTLLLTSALDLGLRSYLGEELIKELPRGIEAVTKLLIDGSLNLKLGVDKSGKTRGNALARAAKTDDKETILRLLKSGADINFSSGLMYNALGAAARDGKLSMVQFLLEKGADVNAEGGEAGNALYLACMKGELAIVQTLLSAGASVNTHGKHHGIALGVASNEKHEDIVRLLLEKGADVNIQSKLYGTALSRACLGGSGAIIRLLLEKGADINAPNWSYGNTLISACAEGDEAMVQLLLQSGADVNLQDSEQRTALHEASRLGNKNVVQLLLEKGADVHLQDSEQRTALHEASRSGNKNVVQLLLEKGADVHLQDSEQRTALHEASRSRNKYVVQLLLEKGA